MQTEAQKRSKKKYDKKNCIQFLIKLNRNTDSDIIKKLENVDNKQGYIKSLIRKDLIGSLDILRSLEGRQISR